MLCSDYYDVDTDNDAWYLVLCMLETKNMVKLWATLKKAKAQKVYEV